MNHTEENNWVVDKEKAKSERQAGEKLKQKDEENFR